jgi:hypothetical protein
MKKALMLSLAASAALVAGGDIAPAAATTTAATDTSSEFLIFDNIQVNGEIRPRYEYVDQDKLGDTANAYTNRLLLGVKADLFQVDGLSVYLEGVNVAGSGDFFDLTNGDIADKGVYPVVADPDQSRVTQAYIDYKFGDTLIRAGRQGVNLDNQRFIGTVNWRQMPQTYDAVAVVNNSIENLDLLGAYVWRVNRIFADDSLKPDVLHNEAVLLHAAYHFMPELTVTAYDYMVEDISDTYGLALTGKTKMAGASVSYRAEYATQQDSSIGDGKADADYYNIEANMLMNGIIAGAQYEVLGGDGNSAFQTPLATLHAHNGWADMFLGTPPDGLVDLNFKLGYKAAGFGVFKVIYHDFSSDEGSTDYGTEWDVVYKNKIPGVKGLTGLLKAASYSADDYKEDTTKFWAMLDYKF